MLIFLLFCAKCFTKPYEQIIELFIDLLDISYENINGV